jgi:hypothetical protein
MYSIYMESYCYYIKKMYFTFEPGKVIVLQNFIIYLFILSFNF